MIKAGELNRVVSLQRNEGGQDDTGQPIDNWVEYAKVSANVLTLAGKELMISDSDVGVGTASIRIRFRTDVTNADRIVYGDTIFNVSVALPDYFTREKTDIVCTFGANQG